MESELSIITLNCWGIPIVSKDRKARMQAIGEELAKGRYDVVCLQEVWTDSDFNLIREKTSRVLPNSHYFYSGVVGSGVCFLSRYPIQEVFFHQWPVNGYVHKLQHGDWFGGKGVGLCRIQVDGYNVNIYSAHLHAEYDRNCDEYQAHRVLQAFDTAQFIKLTAHNADLVVLAGDLNTEPGDLAYRILISVTGMMDAFSQAGDKVADIASTNEGFKNSYTHADLIKKQFPGKRIDYIMYHTNGVKIKLVCYSLPLPDRVPGHTYSYSDHEAVSATLKICENGITSGKSTDDADQKTVLIESMNVCDEAFARLIYHRRLYWFITALFSSLLLVTVGMDAPFGFRKMYNVFRVALTGAVCFTLIMATIWNNIETNAVLAGKLAMEVCLKQLTQKESARVH